MENTSECLCYHLGWCIYGYFVLVLLVILKKNELIVNCNATVLLLVCVGAFRSNLFGLVQINSGAFCQFSLVHLG